MIFFKVVNLPHGLHLTCALVSSEAAGWAVKEGAVVAEFWSISERRTTSESSNEALITSKFKPFKPTSVLQEVFPFFHHI